MKFLVAATLICLAPAPALAEVKSVSAAHFETSNTVFIDAGPATVFAALGRIGSWWNSAHSFSGSASNMSLSPEPGGCFCERLPASGGKVEHLRVVYSEPNKVLRLQGALGPLQAEAVSGAFTWTLTPKKNGTEVTQTYIVSGHSRAGMEKLAPLVDRVLSEQLNRLRSHLSPG